MNVPGGGWANVTQRFCSIHPDYTWRGLGYCDLTVLYTLIYLEGVGLLWPNSSIHPWIYLEGVGLLWPNSSIHPYITGGGWAIVTLTVLCTLIIPRGGWAIVTKQFYTPWLYLEGVGLLWPNSSSSSFTISSTLATLQYGTFLNR